MRDLQLQKFHYVLIFHTFLPVVSGTQQSPSPDRPKVVRVGKGRARFEGGGSTGRRRGGAVARRGGGIGG